MIEPLYNKVYDFGMEFMANADGTIDYLGLSLFDTRGGAYTASICATEKTSAKYCRAMPTCSCSTASASRYNRRLHL